MNKLYGLSDWYATKNQEAELEDIVLEWRQRRWGPHARAYHQSEQKDEKVPGLSTRHLQYRITDSISAQGWTWASELLKNHQSLQDQHPNAPLLGLNLSELSWDKTLLPSSPDMPPAASFWKLTYCQKADRMCPPTSALVQTWISDPVQSKYFAALTEVQVCPLGARMGVGGDATDLLLKKTNKPVFKIFF